ncbi:hypothetical protein ACH5RR_015191 [Cinchona calisaya]|uniref:DUF659 domain-containing protein n=1 Tax=Cinchona calisaya TaxID=153742 RepID=A0ABD2ZSF2_9GENT
MKLHLAGERGSVALCTKVAPKVRHAILGSLKEYAQKAKEKIGDFGEENPYSRSVNDFDSDDIQEIPPPRAKGVSINMAGALADVSDIESNAENLCNLFTEIVEMVGPKNMVHMVRYPTICWSPCAAHCINLILKDIGELSDVKALVDLASTVTVFMYNHKFTLNWLRKSKGWKEIIRPGETRFATTFIALKSLYDWKENLQALVTSEDYKKFLKMAKGKEAKQIVLNDKFWNNSLILVRIMGPLIRLLRVCDVDEKPSMGYVYEGMQRAIEGIRKLFKYKDRLCKPYIDIINFRWDKMLRKNLHSASYFLNPAFQYDPKYVGIKEVTIVLLDYIETYVDWTNQKRSYDPVDYESIDKTEFWVVEEEPGGKLDYEELEAELEELPVDDDVECSNFQQVEDVDLELFQRRGISLIDEDDEWLN